MAIAAAIIIVILSCIICVAIVGIAAALFVRKNNDTEPPSPAESNPSLTEKLLVSPSKVEEVVVNLNLLSPINHTTAVADMASPSVASEASEGTLQAAQAIVDKVRVSPFPSISEWALGGCGNARGQQQTFWDIMDDISEYISQYPLPSLRKVDKRTEAGGSIGQIQFTTSNINSNNSLLNNTKSLPKIRATEGLSIEVNLPYSVHKYPLKYNVNDDLRTTYLTPNGGCLVFYLYLNGEIYEPLPTQSDFTFPNMFYRYVVCNQTNGQTTKDETTISKLSLQPIPTSDDSRLKLQKMKRIRGLWLELLDSIHSYYFQPSDDGGEPPELNHNYCEEDDEISLHLQIDCALATFEGVPVLNKVATGECQLLMRPGDLSYLQEQYKELDLA